MSKNIDRLRQLADQLDETEFQLSSANALIAAIFNGAEEAMLSKDFNGYITSWNPAAERLYGYRREEAVGQHISIIVPEDKRNELDTIMDNIHNGISTKVKTVRRRKDGKRVSLEITVSPVTAANGKIVGASSIAHPPNWQWEELQDE